MAAATLELRASIAALTAEHRVMTVRQVFYALVARGVVPKDENRGYRPVQRNILEMRKLGQLPWSFIADGTRWQRKPETFDSAEDALRTTARTYRRNLWRDQHLRIEVWLEKDALAGVVAETTSAWDVALMISRGVSSATFLHSAVEAANEASAAGIKTLIITLFDFDAGGARAKKMISDYFESYATSPAEIVDVALRSDQVEQWNLPARPAKTTDPQAKKWGDVAVELDAIPPDRLRDLVEEEITSRIDSHSWNLAMQYEQEERHLLTTIANLQGRSS